MKITVQVELTDKALRDALTTGVESGIAYWANQCNGNRVEYSDPKGPDYGVTLLCIGRADRDGEVHGTKFKRHTIKPENLAAAMQWLLNAPADKRVPDHAKVSADYAARILAQFQPDGFYGDANDADVLVQVAAFGQVVFG